ncbi:glycosyltransferase [Dyadobacter frigoris]|uniref:Glycosyltransferase family 4 protein n=1 Tax=Dyadobacter frigoris TaxID=2576211 RepID=A0A4U6CSU2_9BACT|nr:glycosyltransferase [Dyadobacter frigoris]TKT87652.1 glycosyltransferase family 4 protein [Dyadobacter frigoris]
MISDRIIWIIPSFYVSEDYPLRGIFFKEQAEAISKHFKNITLIYPESRSIRDISLKGLIKNHFQYSKNEENGLQVYRKHRWNLLPTRFDLSLGQRLWISEVMKMAERLLNSNRRPDIIHAHCAIGAGIAAMYLYKKYKIPYIITEHLTLYQNSTLTNQEKKTLKAVFENASKVITVSSPFKELLSKVLGLNKEIVSVIPNFIDTDFFSPLKLKPVNANFIFLTVCHLSTKKRIDRLINSFSELIKKGHDSKLIIAGEGTEKPGLMKLVNDLNLSNKVSFLGSVDRQEVRQLMQTCDCFVLPSDIETFGVVLIEALSCGLPVIATKSGGPEDIISPDCGFLVEKNEDDLTKAMINIIDRRNFYPPEKLRDYAVEHYGATKISLQYAQLYEKIIIESRLNQYE